MHIAIVDDDRDSAELIQLWLEEAGHQATLFDKGADFIRASRERPFDVVLLDWMLPDLNGDRILQQLRTRNALDIPVIFITARSREDDIVRILELGADDYLTKPLHQRELLARISAVTRRVQRSHAAPQKYGSYRFDMDSRTVYHHDQPVRLTEMEFNLAHFIFNNIGRLLPRDLILASVWGYDSNVNTRTVDTHMSRIRKKLDISEKNGWRLSSVYQRGYRLEQFEPETAQIS